MAFQLLIARGNSEGQQFVVVQQAIRIGCGEDNDVVLSDAGVSRHHCRIFEKLGRRWIEDLGSANGTLVNGQRVEAQRELKTADAVAIGAALLNFVELQATEEARRPSPKALPSVPVEGRAVTGETPAQGGASLGFDEVITASGEDQLPFSPGDETKLFEDEHEVTAPAGRPHFPDDATQPVGKPLAFGPPPARSKPEPLPARDTAATVSSLDPRADGGAKEPETELGVSTAAADSPLVSATMLRRPPDLTDQATSLVGPEGPQARRPARLEGPTQITAPPAPPVADPRPSINQLLAGSEGSGDSLAPLEMSRSELHAIADATRADARPLFEPPVPASPGLISRPVARHTDAIPANESAADRARRRRLANQSLGAQAAYWWGGLPTRTQAIATAVASLVVTVLIIGLIRFFTPDEGPPLPPEPERLRVSSERVRRYFGLGDGVDYVRRDAKEFAFDFVTPTDAAILIHYLAEEIDREEVAIIVNGADVGFVPPDIGVPDREIETLIPQRLLRRGEKNSLVFDNVRNPPGKERWRVGQIWLELLPVPPATNAEAFKRAKELARHAGQLYAQREVGSENVFRSWKAYRLSWQQLLAVPEEQRTALYEQARRRAEEIGQELDRQCGALMLDAKKQMELRNPERAKEILLEVALYFPTGEHRCHALANEKLGEYEL